MATLYLLLWYESYQILEFHYYKFSYSFANKALLYTFIEGTILAIANACLCYASI